MISLEAVFLYCCLDRLSCPANAIQNKWAMQLGQPLEQQRNTAWKNAMETPCAWASPSASQVILLYNCIIALFGTCAYSRKKCILRNNWTCRCAYIIYGYSIFPCAYIWFEVHAHLKVHMPRNNTVTSKVDHLWMLTTCLSIPNPTKFSVNRCPFDDYSGSMMQVTTCQCWQIFLVPNFEQFVHCFLSNLIPWVDHLS